MPFSGPLRGAVPSNGNGIGKGIYLYPDPETGISHGKNLIEVRGPRQSDMMDISLSDYALRLDGMASSMGIPDVHASPETAERVANALADMWRNAGYRGIRLRKGGADEYVVFDDADVWRTS